VIVAHPHSLSNPASTQRFEAFERFLSMVADLRELNKIRCVQPREFATKALHV
jgi:hypothetical protein